MENEPIKDGALQHKCKKCGGIMVFSPSVGMLKCEYCGATEELDLGEITVKENDFNYWLEHSDQMESEQTLQAEVKCKQCGAVTTFPPDVSSFKCAFCGTPIVLDQAVQQRSWTPEYILPFKVDMKRCNDLFANWMKSLWFLPNELKSKTHSDERFKGVYLPYWTYDAQTTTDYTGERGDDRVETSTDKDGKVQKRTVTDWSDASGQVSREFDDVIVPATSSLPPEIAKFLTNWDKENYVPYDPIYVKGFITEIYKDDFKACYPKAQEKMKTIIKDDVRQDIGGEHQRIGTMDIDYSEVKFKHTLLPVWTSAFRFKDKVYLFAINGRTGQVVGQRPYSAGKIILFVLAIIVVLVLLFKLFG